MHDPLAQLKQGENAFEGNIDATTEALNEEFDKKGDNATHEGTQEMQNEVFEAMYGKSNILEKNPLEEAENKNIEIERKIDEAPNSPLIDRLVEQGLLEIKEGELIKEALVNNSDIETSLNSVEGLDSETTKKVIDTMKKINSAEKKEEGIKNFSKDFSAKIDGLKEVVEGGKKGEKDLVGQNKKLIEKLGSNYIPIGGNQTQTEGLNRAFKISVNQLMNGKQFRRPDTFDKMLAKVKNKELSFDERFNEFKKIDKLINSDQSRANARTDKAFKNREAGSEKEKSALETGFDELKEQVKTTIETENKEKADQLLIEAQEIKEEADSIGDIFISSEIDVLTNDLKDMIENT